MKKLLKRILNILAYTGAGVVILLAIMVGLFRLFLPRLPEYQEDIKAWANAAIGMQVEFAGMNARWRLSGPELNFYDAELTQDNAEHSLIQAAEITVGVGLLRLLVDRTLVVDRIVVRETELDFDRTEDGEVLVQGLSLESLASLIPASNEATDVVVIGQDISVNYRHHGGDQILSFDIELLEASRDDDELSIEASLDLEEGFGSRLDVSADQRIRNDSELPVWQLYFEGRSLGLARWSYLVPSSIAPVIGGSGDVSLWLELTRERINKATANFAVDDLAIQGPESGAPFDIEGRLEFSRAGQGLLMAAENLRLRTGDGQWPRSSIQVQLGYDAEDRIDEISANASYVRMDDLVYVSAWLPAAAREMFDEYLPSGEVSALRLDVSRLRGDSPRFDIVADLTEAGVRAGGRIPGVRGLTGSLRADRTGGRVEFNSRALRLEVPEYIPETLILDDAIGTVIWRRSGSGLTILSDRLQLRNADFDSQSSMQITVPGGDASPVIDVESRWSINDVASIKRFLPQKVISPTLYRWLTRALVSGSVTRGTTRLTGPLDRFPFDAGEGRFQIGARLEDAVLHYAEGWPDAAIRSMDITLDGMRLYSERNTAVTAGNTTVDAQVAIADLREPVLTIGAFATGTLQSIREFARRSPIAGFFGGQLEKVRVDGDASFNLELTYPIRDRQSYDFRTRIQTSAGSLNLVGFDPAITELNGIVTISRDGVGSESLFGTFLGQPVAIELSQSGDDSPSYSVIANARGRATADALIDELGAPLSRYVTGSSEYRATVRFPRAGLDDPVPVQLVINSDLDGFEVALPAPFSKTSESVYPMSLQIEFPATGQILSNGSLGEDLRFSSDFRGGEAGWDFDRGALALGGDYPKVPGSRGLHIHGHTTEFDLQDWMSVARSGARGARGGQRFVDRIRSVDLTLDNLYLLGQHLTGHRFTVDRSGDDWVIRAEGEQVAGTVTIPYDLTGERPIVLDMQSLILPGDESDEDSDDSQPDSSLDPRSLPSILVKAEDFALGERHFGNLAADFVRTPDGLRADAIRASDESFRVEGRAGWIADPTAAGGQRTYVSAKLVSDNVEQTLTRLDYYPGLEGQDMEIDLDVYWAGGPRRDFLETLGGKVGVKLGSGRLNEVEPGAGRVFGLMSVVALPRRLSLDFRDVLDKGFGFDEITGTFALEGGDAYTCDLSLKGPAADIGIVGRAGLAVGDYDQTAIVSANVGNTLPVVGAVVAGPQVAAALLIFSQIFKKPLQEMGQVYYGIDGTFDEPVVEVADAARFAVTSELAGCLSEEQ